MKRFLLRLLIFVLIAGIAVVTLTPVAARQLRAWSNARVVDNYLKAANALSLLDCGSMLSHAWEYDEARGRIGWRDPFAPGQKDLPEGSEYATLLDPVGNGVMSVLELPKLGTVLPVYHGGVTAVSARVAHLPDSSLPAGSAGGQCVLWAGRDRFYDPFAGLNRLIAGDHFYLNTLQSTLVYEVFETSVVSPGALSGQRSDGSEEECVLIAPAGERNDKRLVVRGRRVSRRSANTTDDTRVLPDWASGLLFMLPVALPCLILLAIVEGARRALKRRRRERTKL